MKNIISFATRADAPEILEFIRELARYEKMVTEVSATVADLERTLFGPERLAEVVFIEHEGERAGFALFFPKFSTFLARPGLYLEDLFVKERFRGRGLGRQLLSFLAQLAVERGCARFEWSVLDWNQPAIDFYESLGASLMKEWLICRVSGEALKALAGASSGTSPDSSKSIRAPTP